MDYKDNGDMDEDDFEEEYVITNRESPNVAERVVQAVHNRFEGLEKFAPVVGAAASNSALTCLKHAEGLGVSSGQHLANFLGSVEQQPLQAKVRSKTTQTFICDRTQPHHCRCLLLNASFSVSI